MPVLPRQALPTLPGALASVNGIGVLITGESGTGKSDALLGLIDRGNALVADDVVELRHAGGLLFGRSPAELRGLMWVRDVGIVDIRRLFAAERLVEEVRVELCVHLEHRASAPPLAERWSTRSIMTVAVPQLVLPASTSRDLPLLIELVAREHARRGEGEHTQAAFIAAHMEAVR